MGQNAFYRKIYRFIVLIGDHLAVSQQTQETLKLNSIMCCQILENEPNHTKSCGGSVVNAWEQAHFVY